VIRRIWLALRVFFLTLFKASVADQVEQVLGGGAAGGAVTAAAEPARPKPRPAPGPRPGIRSEALTLLATLQREARLIDFVQEPLQSYTDAQIGAAARNIHRDCGKVLARLFAIQPILAELEGSPVEVPAGFDAGRYRLTGNVTGEPPFHGRLVHAGWQATLCDLPTWSGSEASARVLAPVEIELP
jgi:hypothetical protein